MVGGLGVWGTDSRESIMVVVGGESAYGEVLDELWMLHVGSNTWRRLDGENRGVWARSGHSCCVSNGRVFVAGGTWQGEHHFVIARLSLPVGVVSPFPEVILERGVRFEIPASPWFGTARC